MAQMQRGQRARARRPCARCSSTSQDDPACWAVEDQFMFGPDLLVAPVLDEGARAAVYLPAGTAWTDAWTGEECVAGRRSLAAPLERIPVYLRSGKTLPIRAIG